MQDTPATSSSAPCQSIFTSRLRTGSRSTRLVTISATMPSGRLT
jgi:hypothetical protein